MDIILFNGYVIETDYLSTLNRLIQEKDCCMCKHGINKKGCCGWYYDCTLNDPECRGDARNLDFVFAGIKEITCTCE